MLTIQEFRDLPVGTKVKVVANTCGHSYPIGSIRRLLRTSGGNWILDGEAGFITYAEVELVLVPRNVKIRQLKEKREKAEAELIKLTHELEVITRFKNSLDELSAALFEKIVNGDKAVLTAKRLYTMLKTLGVPEDVQRNPVVVDNEKAA